MEMNINNLAAGVMNYFGNGLNFCLTQPHNTFPDLHSYWLCGKVDQRSGKLIPKTFPTGDEKSGGAAGNGKEAWGLCVCVDSHAGTHNIQPQKYRYETPSDTKIYLTFESHLVFFMKIEYTVC